MKMKSKFLAVTLSFIPAVSAQNQKWKLSNRNLEDIKSAIVPKSTIDDKLLCFEQAPANLMEVYEAFAGDDEMECTHKEGIIKCFVDDSVFESIVATCETNGGAITSIDIVANEKCDISRGGITYS